MRDASTELRPWRKNLHTYRYKTKKYEYVKYENVQKGGVKNIQE